MLPGDLLQHLGQAQFFEDLISKGIHRATRQRRPCSRNTLIRKRADPGRRYEKSQLRSCSSLSRAAAPATCPTSSARRQERRRPPQRAPSRHPHARSAGSQPAHGDRLPGTELSPEATDAYSLFSPCSARRRPAIELTRQDAIATSRGPLQHPSPATHHIPPAAAENAAADGNLSLGSLARQRRSRAIRSAGTPSSRRSTAGSGSLRCACTISFVVPS